MVLRRLHPASLLAALSLLCACGDLPPAAEGATAVPSSIATIAPAPATAGSTTGAGDGPAGASATSSASASASATSSAASTAAPGPVIAASRWKGARDLADHPPRAPEGSGAGSKAAGLEAPVDVSLDGEWLLRLAAAPIVEVTVNKGGGSVSMRVKFADGRKAALKPEQTGHSTDPRAEIAAYHADRILGFGRTAAVAGRRLPHAELRAALVASGADEAFLARFDRNVVARDGHVDAALIAWHKGPLVEEEIEPAWAALLATGDPVPEGDAAKLAERSDLVLFDFLIDNPDRYSGGNILRLGKGGPLVFLDQGAAFGKNRLARRATTKDILEKVCRFRASTLDALASVGPGKPERLGALLAASLGRDALAPVLDAAQIAAVDERAATLAEHVRACTERLKHAVTLPAQR